METPFTPNKNTLDWLQSLPRPHITLTTQLENEQNLNKNNNEINNLNLNNLTKNQWELIEIWRKLIENLGLLRQFEKEKLLIESQEIEKSTDALSPLITKLNIDLSSPSLQNLAKIYSTLPTPLPPSNQSLVTKINSDPTPVLIKSITNLEDRITYLRLELNESNNKLRRLELDLIKKEKDSLRIAAINNQPGEDKNVANRALKTIQMLDLKTLEYQSRLGALQKQINEQTSSSSSSSSSSKQDPIDISLTTLSLVSAKYHMIKEEHTKLKSQLKILNILPSDLKDAKIKLEEKKLRVIELRKIRDKLLVGIGSGVK